MGSRLRSCSIAACLFVFLFVVVGAGLHLKPLGAFLAALSGSFLVIHGVHRWSAGPARIEREEGRGSASRRKEPTGNTVETKEIFS